MPKQILAYAREQREKYLSDLFEYLSIPSVSAQPAPIAR